MLFVVDAGAIRRLFATVLFFVSATHFLRWPIAFIIFFVSDMDTDAEATLTVLSIVGNIPADAEYNVETTCNRIVQTEAKKLDGIAYGVELPKDPMASMAAILEARRGAENAV